MTKESIVVLRTNVEDRELRRLYNAATISKNWIRAIIRQHERDENSLNDAEDKDATLVPPSTPSKHIVKKSLKVLRQLRDIAIRAHSCEIKECKLGEGSLLIKQADHLAQVVFGLMMELDLFLQGESPSADAEKGSGWAWGLEARGVWRGD